MRTKRIEDEIQFNDIQLGYKELSDIAWKNEDEEPYITALNKLDTISRNILINLALCNNNISLLAKVYKINVCSMWTVIQRARKKLKEYL